MSCKCGKSHVNHHIHFLFQTCLLLVDGRIPLIECSIFMKIFVFGNCLYTAKTTKAK